MKNMAGGGGKERAQGNGSNEKKIILNNQHKP